MSFKDRYGFDKKLAEEGTWVSMGGGLDLKLRRSNSKFVRDFVTAENKKHSHLTRGGRDLPTDIAEMISRRVVALAMIVDWRDTPKGELNPDGQKGVDREDGEIVKYTGDVGLDYCIKYPDFMEDVVNQSSTLENFRAQERKEIEGN